MYRPGDSVTHSEWIIVIPNEYRNVFFYLYILSQDGMQPIHHAAAQGHFELMTLLIDKFGVDPRAKERVCYIQINCNNYNSYIVHEFNKEYYQKLVSL